MIQAALWAVLALLAGFARAQQPAAAPAIGSQMAQLQAPQSPSSTTQEIPPTTCGLVTRYSSNVIPDGCLQEARNVIFDQDYGIQRRPGYGLCNATTIGPYAIRRLYEFDAPSGTKYIVAVSSDKVYSAKSDCVK